ncbi:MAG: bacillithiol biosynthesis deacetylase BshB1 [Planctomycetaceae bacterium]|nr:bacillithiol biosynthesis deacetylase BshB1 [Planctomycetaceae bacterium]
MDPLDVLVVAPHPDDAEISVGGTIALSRSQGLRVGVLDLTSGEPTPHGSETLRVAETAEATAVLDLSWRRNLGLPNRSLQTDLDSRRRLAEVFRETRPGILLVPYWQDAHPDHVAASSLCDDARFWAKLSRSDMSGQPFWPPMLLHYFSIHLRIHPAASFVVNITDHIETKMKAVQAYQSQLVTGRSTEHPTAIDDIRDRARYWGWSIGCGFGEPLVNREQVGVRSLKDLL